MSDSIDRAANARFRRDEAAAAADRARERADQDASPAPAEAEERLDMAEDRLTKARAGLEHALERSESAHLAAADLDDAAGKHEAAEKHRAEAASDRRRRLDLEER